MELLFLIAFFSAHMITPSATVAAAAVTFVYGGCSQTRFEPGTPYESNVNSALTSLVNSADSVTFNSFKISLPGSSQSDIVYSLYQCRGDLTLPDCRNCVAAAVSQLGALCLDTSGGSLQLDGCFVKYDNVSFLGVVDKTVVFHKCGPPPQSRSGEMASRDNVLTALTFAGLFYRVSGYGRVQGMAQCTQDLNPSGCQDCLSEAIGLLKSDCESAAGGYMYLSKCYASYSERGFPSKSDGNEKDQNLAIIIGVVVGVAVLIVFLSVLSKHCAPKGGK